MHDTTCYSNAFCGRNGGGNCPSNAANYCLDWNKTCLGNRAPCSANNPMPSWWDGNLSSELITASEIDDLRNRVRYEISRRYQSDKSVHPSLRLPDVVYSGNINSNYVYNQIESMIEECGQGDTGTRYSGNLIGSSEWNTLVNKYNNIRMDCICNSDCDCNFVCSCNINCLCNY